MKKPRISVIVPVYKVEQYIDKCAHSLFNQTLDNVEYIFVNDCSPDKSIERIVLILQEYSDRADYVRFIHHDINRGLPAARQTGLRYATGEYVIHSDSDDWMEPTMLEKMYNAAIASKADLVYCDFNFVKSAGVERYFAPIATSNKSETISNWIDTKWTVIWNILAKRELYTENQVKFPIGIKYCEDFYVGIQLFCYATRIVHIPEALHNYNMQNVSSILHSESNNNMNSDAERIHIDVLDFLKEQNFFDLCNKSISWRYLERMQYCALETRFFKKFKSVHPETHQHILSCPYLNKKVKMMMWCLDKNLDFIVYLFVKMRNFLRN